MYLMNCLNNFRRTPKEQTKPLPECGFILYVKDGICEIRGLHGAMAGELIYVISRDNRLISGMVLQILFTTIIVILFGADSDVDQGCRVVKTDKIMSISLDYRLFGKVLNGLGSPQLASDTLDI